MISEMLNVRPPLAVVACIVLGVSLGYLLTNFSWKITALVITVFTTALLAIIKPEYLLYVLFFALLLMTDAVGLEVREASGILFIEDIDLPGLPPAIITSLLLLFFIYFGKALLLERRRSNISMRFLFIYSAIIFMALLTGVAAGWPSIAIKMDFMRFLFPVLCFYLCINILDDFSKIYRMIWGIFFACFIKSLILDVYYLTGHGIPFAGFRIVTDDSAVLMVAGIMILVAFRLILSKQIVHRRCLLLAIGIIPMIFAIIFSFRRAHWIGQVVSMLFLYIWSPVEQRKRLGVYIIFVVLLLAPFFYYLTKNSMAMRTNDFTLLARVYSLVDSDQSSNRHHYYETVQTLEEILERPLQGLGLGSSHSPVARDLVDWQEGDQPLHVVHNTFVYIFMKMGLPGIIFLLWIGGKYLKRIIRYRKTGRYDNQEPYIIGIGSGIGIWILLFLTRPVPWYFHQTYMIALFSAIVVNLTKFKEAENR